jgi:hypothetical protein
MLSSTAFSKIILVTDCPSLHNGVLIINLTWVVSSQTDVMVVGEQWLIVRIYIAVIIRRSMLIEFIFLFSNDRCLKRGRLDTWNLITKKLDVQAYLNLNDGDIGMSCILASNGHVCTIIDGWFSFMHLLPPKCSQSQCFEK